MQLASVNKAPVQKTRNRKAISAGEVATYIKIGRQKVAGSEYDPYAKRKDPTDYMRRDALAIANWFNSNRVGWDIFKYLKVLREIQDLQYGPALYWKNLLKATLTPVHFRAAESWALRHKAGDYVDVALSPEVRDNVFAVLNSTLRLSKRPEPYRAMLDVLRFAFFGLVTDDSDNALDL